MIVLTKSSFNNVQSQYFAENDALPSVHNSNLEIYEPF